ncbi:PA3496 family putative envelope integrity protein [Aeromonas rivipollensis]|uniref:PA3496 family putative envelope integrity protein n=1 Tax=Aeromonas rivipollensis TaxID=948519 RepID=UPI003D251F12
MKQLTEAQMIGFRGSMPPRTEHRYSVNVEPSAATRQAAKHLTTARRAIEEYHEQRALRLEMEM